MLAYAREELPDYQMAAFLMAGYIEGFTRDETVALTEAMVASNDQLDLSRLSGPTVDKHSDRRCGRRRHPGRGPARRRPGHAGDQAVRARPRPHRRNARQAGVDPRLRVGLGADELLDQVERIGLAVAAQTADLVPADKSIYALRDVTATVGNVALIASSVMSKKLAGGAASILLDVKTGSGAFMHETAEAAELAGLCVDLGKAAGRATAALVTDMNQPLGELVGNAVEVREAAVELLPGRASRSIPRPLLDPYRPHGRPRRHGPRPRGGSPRRPAGLEHGDGLEQFRMFVAAQGSVQVVDDLSLLPQPRSPARSWPPRTAGWRRSTPRPSARSRPPWAPAGSARTTTSTRGGGRAVRKARRPDHRRPADRPHPGPRRRRRPDRGRRPPGRPPLERPPTAAPPLVTR